MAQRAAAAMEIIGSLDVIYEMGHSNLKFLQFFQGPGGRKLLVMR